MADTQVIRCPTCGANNRVPLEKVKQGLQPVCGRCKTPLTVESKPVIVTDATFSSEIELAAEFAGRVRVAKLNVDENPATASRFHVQSIPTLLVLKGGKEVERIVGVQPKTAIVQRLQRVAA